MASWTYSSNSSKARRTACAFWLQCMPSVFLSMYVAYCSSSRSCSFPSFTSRPPGDPAPRDTVLNIPPQIRDDQYEFRVITDDHFDNEFGPYESFLDGHLVPYPSRVEGTEMWQKARDVESAASATSAAASAAAPTSTPSSSRGRGRGRGGIKRKPMGDPDGQPTPKRSTRNTDESLLPSEPVAPAPAKGLLASAAEADMTPEGTAAGDDESPSATPEPGSFYANVQAKMPEKMAAREKSPPLPKNVGEPDEHGVRRYNQRPYMRDKSMASRLLAPPVVVFDDDEIGFRDSVNDSSKGHTRAKRGKYLDTPNSNGMHFDLWCNSFDYSSTTPRDFDQRLVERHGVHPRYGIFLPTSINESEDPEPYIMPGKPVVFIANLSGRISHASRSFQKTVNHHSLMDGPWRHKMGALLRRFCKLDGLDQTEISVDDYLPTERELKRRSLGTAVQELKSRPVLPEISEEADTDDKNGAEQADVKVEAAEASSEAFQNDAHLDLSVFAEAAAYIEAQDAANDAAQKDAARAAQKPTKYDAVRDLFMTESKPAPPPPAASTAQDVASLSILADLATSNPAPEWPGSGRARTAYPADVPPPVSSERETSYNAGYPTTRHHNSHVDPSPYGAPVQAYPPPSIRDHHMSQAPPPPAPYGMPAQEQPPTAYPVPAGSYPPLEGSSRAPYDHSAGYDQHRRMSAFAGDGPSYTHAHPYWSPRQSATPGPPMPSHHYPIPPPPPPAAPSRVSSFASSSSQLPPAASTAAEPLPPLRPPRGRHQSAPEEVMMDGTPIRQMSAQPYYTTGRSSYGAGPEPYGSAYQLTRPPPGYAASPPQGYDAHRAPSSPTPFASETAIPAGAPPPPSAAAGTSVFHSRSTPSASPASTPVPTAAGGPIPPPPAAGPVGSSSAATTPGSASAPPSGASASATAAANDAKYRKLQPAPVPAHRAWNHRPELKTIPYDHKDSSGGAAAALPNSGPTQIRGWNVNQHRRRNRADRQSQQQQQHGDGEGGDAR